MLAALLMAAPADAGHPRAKKALSVYTSLVPAYQPCTAANRTHGPPLAFPSCSPPAQVTNRLTAGNPPAQPANLIGYWHQRVTVGTPGPPEDSCAPSTASIDDVRCNGVSGGCAGAGADYTGEVEVRVTARMSDHWNAVTAGGGVDPATVQDIDLRIPAMCTATSDPSIGGSCGITTDLQVIYPGSIKDGKRAIIEIGQARVFDGGDDGDTATDDGAATFLTQGVFVP